MEAIRQRWGSVGSKLDERGRRVFAAGEVRATGWGGLEAVSEITGLARSTIGRGLKDLDAVPLPKGRVRRKGGGRRHLLSRDTTLIEDLRNVIEPATLGDPMRPLLWVSKSYDKLASALQKKGHEISASSVKRLLPTLGYSRQSNRKADEGSKHPDRNAQFEHINAKAIAAQAARQPVISVDTKKKELIGNYKNGGTDYKMYGVNSALYLPLLREEECIGLLALVGKRPNIFGAAEIAQAESFRDQALIAIENARLFEAEQQRTRELTESLEQQTATSEVLQVISGSPGDLEPVFSSMLQSAPTCSRSSADRPSICNPCSIR
jgi:hypothetical protein